MSESTIRLEISSGIATLTLNRPRSLNALTPADYAYLTDTLRELDANDQVVVTVIQAEGKWFCAGTDVKAKDVGEKPAGGAPEIRKAFTKNVVNTTVELGNALYSHRKILVAALNGPVMGIMAAFLGYFDFIYALPNVWLSCPFTFLGITAEGGASVSFVNRMGLAMAKEVLIWGKKKEAQELLNAGFLNKIYPEQSVASFHNEVRKSVLYDLEGLDPTAVLSVKNLIQAGLHEKNNMDAVNLREGYAQAARFASGSPAERFRKIATKEIKHKL